MEDVFSEELWEFSHEFHKLWFILEITDEFVFLLDFEVVIFQNNLLQRFLG